MLLNKEIIGDHSKQNLILKYCFYGLNYKIFWSQITQNCNLNFQKSFSYYKCIFMVWEPLDKSFQKKYLQVNHSMKWKCRLIALFLDRKCDKNCHFTCNLIAKSSAVRFLEFIKACLKKYNSVLIINTLQWDSRTIFGLGRAYWPKRP